MEKGIFKKIELAPKPDFGDIFSKSFELFKKVWVEGMIHALISMVCVIPVILLVYAPFIPAFIETISTSGRGYYEPVLDYPVALIVLYGILVVLLTLFIQVVVSGINLHFYRVLRKEDTGYHSAVGGYFIYLKHHLKKLVLLNLAIFGISLGAALLCYLPIFYVLVPLQLIIPIFAFNTHLTAADTIRAGFKLGNRFWLTIFGLIIISSIIAQAGILLCLVGVVITAYFVHIPMYYVYKDTIGFDDPTPASV